MSKRQLTNVCFFGGYEKSYPRSALLRRGLERMGVGVRECATSPRRRSVVRYTLLVWRYLTIRRDFEVVYVPEFRHKDVPLAYFLTRLTRKRLVFDPLVSRFDTKVLDRGDATERSAQAWHNRNWDRSSLTMCDLVLADTEAHAFYYASEFKIATSKIRVLPVGFDESVFNLNGRGPGDMLGDDRFTVLFFGNYLPLHGVDVIVDAASRLRDRKDILFRVIGRGQTFAEIEGRVKQEGLSNILLEDRVAFESLPAVITSADLCLGIFGRTEKATRVIPNKVYQCMACGRPVVTADTPAMREVFRNGDNVCLVPAGDGEALAKAIASLAGDPERCHELATRAARLVHDRFTSAQIASRFVQFCSEMMR